ncbi:MAG: GWxTD domain-containing protein, partial [Balneolaceae bacterium]
MATLLILLAWMQTPLLAEAGQETENWLSLGHEAEAAGKYEEALNIWVDARARMATPSIEMGLEYIRLATEQQLRGHYPMAASFYQWALSAGRITERDHELLSQELARLKPLAGEDEFREWTQLLALRDPLLLEKLTLFWNRLDPLPGRNYNPRLAEHWERIAYAKRHFQRRNEPPYGTDERGPLYVQYGEPDHKETGFFPLKELDVRRLLQREEADASREIIDILQREAGAPHNYEIWIYYSPNEEMPFNLVLMFGEKAVGGFGQLHTLADLIPSRLFTSQRGGYGFAAMAVLEIYYDHLSTLDTYFSHLYQTSLSRRSTALVGGYATPSTISRSIRSQHSISTHQNMMEAPEQISTEENNLPEIPLHVTQYRLLDEEGAPLLLSFLESRPTVAFLYDQEEEQVEDELLLGRYRLIHGMNLMNRDRNTLTQTRIYPTMIIDPLQDSPSSSAFTLSYHPDGATQLFFAELENLDPEAPRQIESLMPETVRGAGRLEVPLPEPLPLDGSLLLGDLILGFEKSAEPE